jgi:hypothetical protein
VLWNFHQEVFAWGWSKFVQLVGQGTFPETSMPNFEAWLSDHHIMPILSAANDWIPLSEGAYLLGVYCLLLATLTPMKMLLRRIPGING